VNLLNPLTWDMPIWGHLTIVLLQLATLWYQWKREARWHQWRREDEDRRARLHRHVPGTPGDRWDDPEGPRSDLG
jgi:hypothetical protein